jgi:hypothetical protein
MNKYSGIDLHSNNCVVVVSDPNGGAQLSCIR